MAWSISYQSCDVPGKMRPAHVRQFYGHHWLIYRSTAQSGEDFSLITKVSGSRIGWASDCSIMETPYAFG